MMRAFSCLALAILVCAILTPSHAAVAPQEPSRFDPIVIQDPGTQIGTVAEIPSEIPGFAAESAAWDSFKASLGGRWTVHVDRRTGSPTLVRGRGISWATQGGSSALTLDVLEQKARALVDANSTLFRVKGEQLVLNTEASQELYGDKWAVVFDRVVDGIPVEGQSFVFYVSHGNLVSFGTGRWGSLDALPQMSLDVPAAQDALYEYMGIGVADTVTEVEPARLVVVPKAAGSENQGVYDGPVGQGIAFATAWRFAVEVAGERGVWVGKVDAQTGEVIALYDDVKYAEARGGVFPLSNDGACFDGCEQVYPMPWLDITIDGSTQTTGDAGLFSCTPAASAATTSLEGTFVRMNDRCGAISESVTCDNDLDIGTSGGTDCVVPAGASAGNTHASRSCYFHTNRVKEKTRYWFNNGNSWVDGTLTCDVNINNNCNANWSGGEINFFTSGGGCGNTGEIGGVIHHEYGHGIDQNDGGGFQSNSEAYADAVAIIQERVSCVGRGFRPGSPCTGYGDTCLTCTGIREHDWDARQAHTPATPSGFVTNNCGGGGGACGRAPHCESYVTSESLYDLATRDLPATGLDANEAWQLVEKLWWASRPGSGGDQFNCSLPSSDSCGAGNWMQQMLVIDDDDGNLANGTPHAAAIFAAFDRHDIACGLATDPENQSTSGCPALAQPVLNATAGSNSASLSWNDVPNAANYLILRNEIGCDYSYNVVDTVAAPTLNYTDVDLPNDIAYNFRVQAQGANTACESAPSACQSATPQPFAGSIKLDRASYGCSTVINITVRDANVGAATVNIDISSDSETTPETLVLNETAPGSARFVGSIATTPGPASGGDSLLSLAHADQITAEYVDADDGAGLFNQLRQTTATADCVFPIISNVQESGISDVQATITWSTDEGSDSVVRWGGTTPPSNTTSDSGLTTSHGITLNGLQECTVYFYEVESTDPSGNVAVDDAGGAYYRFETFGDLGQGLQPCHAGRITILDPVYGCSESVELDLVDIDLNTNPSVVDTIEVTVTSTSETTPEIVTLTETGANTSRFTGSITTAFGAPVASDGLLQTAGGDFITATYNDEDDGTGLQAVSFSTADADCSAPVAAAISFTEITDESANLRLTLDEIADATLEWGPTPALGNVQNSASLLTTHDFPIAPLTECDRFYFRLTSTDDFGNTTVFDAAGSPFEWNAYEIPGAIFKDEFESLSGWSINGEWEIGPPQGLGSSPGDPTQAFEGTDVLGHDLSGLGANPGNYEPQVIQRAESPVIDASALTNGQLKFRRWLNVGGGGFSRVQVRQNSVWTTVWQSPQGIGVTESDWSLQTINVAQYADGNGSLQVAFGQEGGFTGTGDAGWNIDRFIVRDGTLPSFDACGSCGGAPTFSGVRTVSDDDGCAGGGVTLTWDAAPAWGSGHAGTYSVYRDTTPGFTPSGANLVASGVTGTQYTDTTAPLDSDVYYVVRAENDETCSSGPSNGGVLDGNTVEIAARDESSQVAPDAVGFMAMADTVNDAHVLISWPAANNAAEYHVYRDTDPAGAGTQIGNVAGQSFQDRDELGDPNTRYYRVFSSDSCGNETPETP